MRPRRDPSSPTVRLHILMTEKEVAALDEWQHENRIPNRCEAIRRAIAIVAQPSPPKEDA